MKIVSQFLMLLPVSFLVAICGCGGGTTLNLRDPQSTITISSHPASLAVNGTMKFTATITGCGICEAQWNLEPDVSTPNVGTLSNTIGSPVTYTAPSTPPIYSCVQSNGTQSYEDPLGQGIVGLFVQGGGIDSTSIIITSSSVATGIFPTTASVALGSTTFFNGYAVGDVNNAVTFQVNGIMGGSSSLGTINNASGGVQGYYTAPATMPASGDSVTITVVSQADPTKSSSAVVTLH